MFSSYSHLDLRCEKQIDILTLRKSHFMLSYFHYAYVVAVYLLWSENVAANVLSTLYVVNLHKNSMR